MTEDQERRLEVIMEEMNGKFDLLLEGHTALDHKIERVHAATTENHREAMVMIRTVHDSLKTEIRATGVKVDGHEARIDDLEKKVA